MPAREGKRASSRALIVRDLLLVLRDEGAGYAGGDDYEALADVVGLELLLLVARGRDDYVGRSEYGAHEEAYGRAHHPRRARR